MLANSKLYSMVRVTRVTLANFIMHCIGCEIKIILEKARLEKPGSYHKFLEAKYSVQMLLLSYDLKKKLLFFLLEHCSLKTANVS